jgi:hypothetical protein
MVFKDLSVRPELDAHGSVIRGRGAGHNSGGAHGAGDTVHTGKLVQATDAVRDHGDNHEFGEATKREAMHTRAEALLNGPNRTFHFANVTVGRDDVHLDGA